MFEQAVLSSGPSGRRVWTTGAGLVGQAGVVTAAILGTLLWPEALPKVQAMLVAPPVPVMAPPPAVVMRPRDSVATPRPVFDPSKLVAPTKIPEHPTTLLDDSAPQIAGAITGGGTTPAGTDFLARILGTTKAPPPAAAIAVEKPKPVAKPAEASPIQRVAQGGRVSPPRLLQQIQPIYPPLARTTHIGGKVELAGVIGADGRVRELRVLSGHPFLTKAALDAVAQWVYAPTRLNGQIVEVITNITVTFQLSQ